MACISDLPQDILAQILFEAAATPTTLLFEWKYKLPLLAVCRKWTKLAIGIVFSEVYVELTIPQGSSLNDHPAWTSNAELLILRGCILAARRLTIELADIVAPVCLQNIALETLKLDRVDWQHINSLTITGPSLAFAYYIDSVTVNDLTSADIACTMQYFWRNLRNVVDLSLSYSNIGSMGNYICECFAKIYGGQLQIHRASISIQFICVNFSRNIKVLELNLDSAAALHLPIICGETLKVLKLGRVPHNFAWHHFRYEIFVRPIIFHQLTILYLYFEAKVIAYTEGDIRDKVESGARNCDQPVFPALKELTVINCTPDCDLLYADIPFPELRKVYLSGTLDNIRHCSRLKLAWVGDLSVEIHSSKPDQTAEVYKTTNHLFADICIGRAASLLYNVEQFPLDPELLRWVNLTKLEVITVDYATTCKLIARLPTLRDLHVFRLKFGVAQASGLAPDGLLYCCADPMMTWGEKLALIKIVEFDEDIPLAAVVEGVQDLVLHTSALSQLHLPDPIDSYLSKFIDAYK
ncbi:hypothetical protein FBU31_001096, partial [Coemansia sp. 'formosensis']